MIRIIVNRMFTRMVLFLFICIVAFNAMAEDFVVSSKIQAFDCEHPDKIVGYFETNTKLEIESYSESNRMYRVHFRAPNGSDIFAFCKPEAIGKGTSPATAEGSVSTNAVSFSSKVPVFDSLLHLDPSLWQTASSAFALKQSRFGFEWVSSTDQNASRCGKKLPFTNLSVYETIVRFDSGKLHELSLLLYGRGDAQTEIDETAFNELLKKSDVLASGITGDSGKELFLPESALNLKKKSWFKPPYRIDLEWSVTRNSDNFRPEYIRLRASPLDPQVNVAELLKTEMSDEKPKITKLSDLKNKVTKDANGDVYVSGIPMVDQGPKGYCVVATAERLLRFYGLDFDQNQIAKFANTDTSGGTSSKEMIKSLGKIVGHYSLITRALKEPTSESFYKELNAYNNLAKKKNKKVIPIETAYDTDIYELMNDGILKEARLQNYLGKKKFSEDIVNFIDKGTPLLWSVTLGYVAEIPKIPIKGKGGHMRLIIGYNCKNADKPEVIYSDSWGAGHEFKRMSMDDAFFITTSLYSAVPTL